MPRRILIIDDDERLTAMLVRYLGDRDIIADARADARSGLAALEARSYDALVLDVMLPDGDGFELCRAVRGRSELPILMLTARGDELDRIIGLELGADDYVPKPFNPRELLARIRAVLRRRVPEPRPHEILRFGGLEIDRDARELRVDGEPRQLTAHQLTLLLALVDRAGRVQSREQLVEAVGTEGDDPWDRSVDVHISRIRAVIEADPRNPRLIRTVRGAGYVFSPPREDER